MRIGRSIAAWSIALALGFRPASALDPNTRITQYRHSAWRVQDGAFESAPNVVAQTADGYIWIGTGSGLVKYDGVRSARWAPPPGKSLANPNIISLLGSSDGTLWIGTAAGLLSWKNNDLREQLRYRINGIIQDRKGRIWVARTRARDGGGLCQVTGEHPGCVGGDGRMKLPNAVSIAEDLHGNLWVGGAIQLLRWHEGSFDAYFREQLVPRNLASGVESVAAASDGSVWASVPGEKSLALVHIVDGSPKPVVLAGVKSQSFTTLFVDREGSLWLGSSDHGLYRLYGGRVDHFGVEQGLSSNTVSSLFEDREGNLWVATSKGLDFFRDSRVITFSASEGLSSDIAASVLASDDGTVWIGNKGHLDALRDGQITAVPIPGKRVTALLQDHARRLWVGIDNMLTIYEKGQFHKVNRPGGSPLGITTAMAEDREQNIWAVANPDRKVFRIRDLRVQEEFDVSRMPISRAVAADPSGGVWLGFLDSFGHYRNGKLEVIKTNGASVASVLAEADGSLWAATRSGLIRWKDGRAETLTSKNGLPCDLIYSVIHDNHTRAWLYTKCGLIGIADSELQRWWRQPGIVIQAQLLDALDGAMPRSNTFQPGVTKSPDGRLWFVNDSVVQMLDPNRLGQTGLAPPVYVEQVSADRKEYGGRGPVRLPAHTRDIEISYTALSYSIPERARFRYKLEGFDRDWLVVNNRRQAFYANLPPGNYRFRVSACNNSGVWNEAGTFLDFAITPAFYQTTWFRLACFAGFLTLLGALYRLRMGQVTRQFKVRLEERVNERTRIARDLHDTLLQTLQGSKMVAEDALDEHADPIRMRRALESVLEWLGRAVEEGRSALNSLRSSTTEENALAEALRRAGEECRFQRSIEFRLSVEGAGREMHPIVRDEVYRIAYEAIRNACVHSGASRLSVELSYVEGLSLRVKDNGRGIDPDVAANGKSGHFGLIGMYERASRIRGKLTLSSSPGLGTEVKLVVPRKITFLALAPVRPHWYTKVRRAFGGGDRSHFGARR